MKVEILETEPEFNLVKGEVYKAIPYWLDPIDKFTLVRRIPDGFNPNCNVYKQQVKVLKD